jgi:chromosome segregation ATPase
MPQLPHSAELTDLRAHFQRWLAFSPDARPSAEELCRELSALTLREERRARRMSTLRWALPSLVAVLAMFSAVVIVLSREAAHQRVEARDARARAAQAKERAASIYASYTVEEARRRELEADVARLEREYQTSRMTRDELASHLAQSEAELSVLGEREKSLLLRLRQEADSQELLRTERDALLGLRDSLSKQRDDTQQELDRVRNHRSEQEAELNRTRELLRQRESVEEAARARISELEARLKALHQSTPAPEPSRPNRQSMGEAL